MNVSEPLRRRSRLSALLSSAIPGLPALALLAVAMWMRMHNLGAPFDRDSYDEGVYWQTLRAMSAGGMLYRDVFCSQPPVFILSVFPVYILFGQTLWAARLGIVILSVFGLLGAYLLGRVLGKHPGALAALLLLVADPHYLAVSRTLQAEGAVVPLSLLAVALAYLWWDRPDSKAGFVFAALAGLALSLSILSKLLAVTAIVPVGLLAITHIWRTYRRKPGTGVAGGRSVLVGVAAFVAVTVLVLMPFLGALDELWQGVVTFHLRATELAKDSQSENFATIRDFLTASPTAYAALCGTGIALWRRDWRVLPLVAWLAATVGVLWSQVPLFPHHLPVLTPILVALVAAGPGPVTRPQLPPRVFGLMAAPIVLLSVFAASMLNLQAAQRQFQAEDLQAESLGREWLRVAGDLRESVGPGQLVITDSQFIAALADDSTPARLVDTSTIRISSGYLSAEQLIEDASRPDVQAVLFYSGRLKRGEVREFGAWVAQHFRLVRSYGNDHELWER